MTPIAITFLVLSMLLVWGGLAVSIVLLRRDVEEPEADAPPAAPSDPPRRTPRSKRRGGRR